jgi:hypothetical protein
LDMRLNNRIRKCRLALAGSCLLATAMLATMPASAAITVSSDPILFWNDIALKNVITNAPAQTRIFAMANIAMHDAVNATLGGPNRGYLTGVISPGGDSRAAAAQAAHDVLAKLNFANAAIYDAELDSSLALIGDGVAKTNGIATGAAYAAAILANRTGDGSANIVTYTTTGLPGDWRPTPPLLGAPAVPQWGGVKTFVLSAADAAAVHPGPHPALDSAEYAAAYNEVKEIGSLSSLSRTADQTASALFWDVANGGTWIRVGLTIAEDEGFNTLQLASAFSTLSTGLADAAIEGFAAKYDYRLWRPVTAIQLGDIDPNSATIGDPDWKPLFNTPAHPSYISTHSALSATGASILSAFFGDDEGFKFFIGPDSKTFTSLREAELDAANSRLWGGIHFRFDNDAGLALGRGVGARVLAARLFQAVPEPSNWAMMIAGFACVGVGLRNRRQAFKKQPRISDPVTAQNALQM